MLSVQTCKMKISFISTVFNEEENISSFIESVLSQTKKPDEIVIVDGGSSDLTVAKIKNSTLRLCSGRELKIIIKQGNRSVGRNEAIKNATGDVILCSDTGCVLDKKWTENIIKPFKDKTVDVVAGYYRGKPRSIFEKCLVPYVLVMPDRVNPDNFLPATRSMAFRKEIWKKIGGFDERFSHNEDYVFAKKLKKINSHIVFEKRAIVYWIPRNSLKEAFIMFYRFAKGDSEAKIFRPKVILLFTRHIFFFLLLLYSFFLKSNFLLVSFYLLLIAYVLWSIVKNYKYIKDIRAIFFLPLIQITSDIAVIMGTVSGLSSRKITIGIILLYFLSMISVIDWGIPNPNHPYNYHMDEWHQLQSIRAIFEYGTPNVAGAANGTVFQFLLSGIYLSPFVLFKIIDPISIRSGVESLLMQKKLFEILRLNTLIFGILSLLTLSNLVKKYLKINPILSLILFTVTPLWLALSNYFKYDIALTFWIIASLFYLLKYGSNPTLKNYIIAGIFCSLAVATKISAIPLFLIYVLSFLYFNYGKRKNYKELLIGLLVFLSVFLVLGIPDLILQKGDYREYLYSNLIRDPMIFNNFILKYDSWWIYLIKKVIPLNFGYVFSGIIALSLIYWSTKLNFKKFKNETFLFISMVIFILSLIPLKLGASGNRLLVLLPFFAVFSSLFVIRFIRKFSSFKHGLYLVLVVLFIVQFFQSFSMISMKWEKDIRELSSAWLAKNIVKGSTIGIQNIPIYQLLPDLIVKEFYSNKKDANLYKYEVINSQTTSLPNVVVVTNREFGLKYLKKSPKKLLISRLNKEGYKLAKEFKPPEILYRIMGDELDFYTSGIIPTWTITIYKLDEDKTQLPLAL